MLFKFHLDVLLQLLCPFQVGDTFCSNGFLQVMKRIQSGLVYFSYIIMVNFGEVNSYIPGDNFILSTLALSDCASYLIACRKYSTACSYSLEMSWDHVHGVLGLPQGLFIILVFVLLCCLGDQVYGLLKCVARHGRHSAYRTASSLKSYLRLQSCTGVGQKQSTTGHVITKMGHISFKGSWVLFGR